MAATLLHGTAVAIDGRALLLRGASGSGKSDLALRLIDAGAQLVADDQSEAFRDGARLLVRPPEAIAGLIEIRGIGIARIAYCTAAPLVLVVDLVTPERLERLPEARYEDILGIAVPLVVLAPFEASAAAKLRAVMAALGGGQGVSLLSH